MQTTMLIPAALEQPVSFSEACRRNHTATRAVAQARAALRLAEAELARAQRVYECTGGFDTTEAIDAEAWCEGAQGAYASALAAYEDLLAAYEASAA